MESSHTYKICPLWLRKNGFEVNQMSRQNCYSFKPHPKADLPEEQRLEHYDRLVQSIIRSGFVSDPIKVRLNRNNHNRDKIIDGHHRLGIAIELGHKEVPVVFEYE